MHDDDIVDVYAAADLGQAHFLQEMLANAEIEARVVGDSISTGLGYPPVDKFAPRLWVRRADEARARELLAEFEKIHARPHPDDEPRAAWKCSACGELVEDDFELCWNCQNPRQPY
jgi:rubrerythrin